MTKKIKLLSLLICIGLLSGCGKTKESTPNTEDANTPTPTSDVSTLPDEEEVDIKESVDTTAIEPIVINVQEYYDNIWDEETGKLIFELHTAGITTDGDKYPKLAQSLQKFSKDHMAMMTEQRDRTDIIEEDDEFFETGNYSSVWDISVNRADTKMLSFDVQYYSYLGGAHGYYSNGGYTYDTASGKLLTLKDVITDLPKLEEIVLKKLSDISEEYGLYDDYEAGIKSEISEGDGPYINWDFDNNGMNIWFNPYDIAPYASGIVSINIKYNEYPNLINEQYCLSENKNADIITELGNYGMLYEIDLDNDGQDELITIEQDISYAEDENGDYYDTGVEVTVSVGKTQEDLENHSVRLGQNYRLNKPYIVTSEEGKHYVYIEYNSFAYGNDLVVVDINDLENGPTFVDWVPYGAPYNMPISNADCFYLCRQVYMMGAYEAYRRYKVGKDGMPEPLDDEYIILPSEPQRLFGIKDGLPMKQEFIEDKTLTLIKPLRFYYSYASKDDKTKGEYKTYDKDQMLYPVYTDGETYITFITEDGTYIDLKYDDVIDGDWGMRIQGYSDYQLLKGSLYMGYC